MSSFDMSQYLSVFLDEAEEQLQIMDEGFIELEQNGDDADLLNRIFRAAHTLKGASASMGFNKMAELTHEMETLLDKVRQGELAVDQSLVDVLLECHDVLQAMKEGMSDGQEQEVDITELVAKLKANASGGPGAAAEQDVDAAPRSADSDGFTDIEKDVIQSAQIKGYNVYHIKVSLYPDCQMKSVRAYLVFNNLEDLGEAIKTVPTTEEIEDEKFDLSFELVFVTNEDMDKISNVVKSISEIEDVVIKPVNISSAGETAEIEAEAETAVGEETAEPREESAPKEIDVSAAKSAKPAKAAKMPAKAVSQTVRVDVKRLENLMNLVGELVIDRTRLADVGTSVKGKLGVDELSESMEEISVHIGRITSDLQEEIMKARMLPIEQVFNRFPRMVRDLAKQAGKEIDFIVEGQETELDRTVIEEVGDPLIHLLRNAIDHGIEPNGDRVKQGKPAKGTVKLNAFHQENQIVITVSDDGRGIDPEKVRKKALEKGVISQDAAERLSDRECTNLIFAPGFSTAEKVSNVSGRGVGMDIVRSHIEKINGIIDIESKIAKGSVFTIKLPLTLAINRSLLVRVSKNVLAFPLVNVVEIINVERDKVRTMQHQEVTLVRGSVLPLFKLNRVLGWSPSSRRDDEKLQVVVVGISEKRVGFVVDALIGEQEIVIKPLGDYIGQVPGLAGATIMGDGKVALILDVRGLVEHTGAMSNYERAN